MASSDGYELLPQREGAEAYPPPQSPAFHDSKEREQQPALPPPTGSRRQRVLVVLSVLVAFLVGGSVGAVLAGTDVSGSIWLSLRSSLLLGCEMSTGNILCGDAYNQPGCKSFTSACIASTLTFPGTTGAQTSGADNRKQRFGTSQGVTMTGKLEANSRHETTAAGYRTCRRKLDARMKLPRILRASTTSRLLRSTSSPSHPARTTP